MKILITGGNGYIAQHLYQFLKPYYQTTLISRKNFDLADSKAVNSYFKNKKFDVVIHTAVKGGSRLEKDDWCILDNNLQMYYNLLRNKNCYKKFINLTSGAELFAKDTPYGLSKNIISKSILDKDNFFNVRIFAVFNENEKDSRFIKSCILRYLKKEPMILHENKIMDFFYMNDFCKLIQYYIENKIPPKSIDCTYSSTYTLLKIAEIINTLDKHRVDIKLLDNKKTKYSGTYTPLLKYEGLECGIQKTFNKIKNANLL